MKSGFINKLVKPSTRAFFEQAGKTPGFSLFDRIHGYIYGRWTYLYISIGTGEHPLSRFIRPMWNILVRIFYKQNGNNAVSGHDTFAEGYHGKVVPLGQANRLVTVNQAISLKNLEHIIPYKHARDIILENPDHIVVLDCPCRAARSHPCLPLDVCLIIGEPFARFAVEHHPHRARWINQEIALDILQAEHERGHVHHAFFKDAMLGRFYAICNCCSCCCGAMQAWNNGTPMLASSGYISRVDKNVCTGCGACIEFCQFKALDMIDGKVRVNEERCMGCGVCVSKCEHEANILVRDTGKSEPLDIQKLAEN
jgi:ferredoxin